MKKIDLLFAALMIFSLTISCKSQQEATNTSSSSTSASASERSSAKKPKKGRSVDDVFKMDTNNDGKLSKTEIKGRLLKNFDKIDLDQDGFITKEELEKAPKPQRGQRPPKGN